MSIFKLELNQAEAAEASGVSSKDIQNWISRGSVVGHREGDITGGGTRGKPRAFSFFSVMNFALAKELIDLKVAPARALKAAADFAHTSGGGVLNLPQRLPGLPFHYSHGYTIFAAGSERTWEDLWKPGERYDTYGNLQHHLGHGFTTANASNVFDLVCHRLMALTGQQDFHPNKVLDSEYPADASSQEGVGIETEPHKLGASDEC